MFVIYTIDGLRNQDSFKVSKKMPHKKAKNGNFHLKITVYSIMLKMINRLL
jgi:hypothetical protein